MPPSSSPVCLCLKVLFEEDRFPHLTWQVATLLLYSPAGIILAVLRVFIAVHAYLAALLLPQLTFIRSFILRTMCIVLGVIVEQENASERDEAVRVLASNHITRFDHLPIHLATSCITPSMWELPRPLAWALGLKSFSPQLGRDALVLNLQSHLSASKAPLLLHPEEEITSGKVALLKFSTSAVRVCGCVQPICISVWRPPLVNVATNVLGSTAAADFFWFLFTPFTVFKLKYLPVIRRTSGETDEEMTRRLEQAVAKGLKIATTKHTAADKCELEKRYLKEYHRGELITGGTVETTPARTPPTPPPELKHMAAQVAEVLPYVPRDIIINDLMKTRCVDLTITNILDGTVRYTPLPEQQAATGGSPSSPSTMSQASSNESLASTKSSLSCSSSSGISLAMDMSASKFSRSAQDRVISFADRKAKLIESARKRYMEKHGLTELSQPD